MPAPRICVVLPVYRQEAFLDRALAGLLAQDLPDWELVVVDDGTPDPAAIPAAVHRFPDPRVRLVRLPANAGLGAACNRGLDLATAPLVGYLPADDVIYPDHLASLVDALAGGEAVAAVAGVRHHGGTESLGPPDGFPPQLVQVAHRRTADRWLERPAVESDDLDRLFWHRLRRHGPTVRTGRVTCEWVDHPGQRHKAIREAYDGGLNVFRSRYAVATPLRFSSTDGGEVDEVELYAPLRERRFPGGGMRVLLAGELAYNPERVLALAARGHRLLGAWTPDGLGASTVGPLPFGHVEEAGGGDPDDVLRRARPDVVYALLNWRAVPFCAALLRAARARGIRFVWH
ncbi:MAG TPA: glycosyltransferase family 2 protein, partial [Mycobacteriales bacterium]|nr:glycosyltransferase family 2 protein [Mycobacteriales bacterium]